MNKCAFCKYSKPINENGAIIPVYKCTTYLPVYCQTAIDTMMEYNRNRNQKDKDNEVRDK